MGIGNLENVIRGYLDAGGDEPIAELVAAKDLSFAQLFFDSSPPKHAQAYEILAELGDDSSLYLWKVLASKDILEIYREERDALRETARLATSKATARGGFPSRGRDRRLRRRRRDGGRDQRRRAGAAARCPRARLGQRQGRRRARRRARRRPGDLSGAATRGAGDAELHRRAGAKTRAAPTRRCG